MRHPCIVPVTSDPNAEVPMSDDTQPTVSSRGDGSNQDRDVGGLWLRFLSGPDIDALGLTPGEIVDAATDVVAAHGRGETVFEPRTHLEPDNDGRGHFNILRGHVSTLGDHGVSGVKVVGDFVPNFELGLPSELALLTLYDPWTGVPLAILDATLITEVRTGAMTAVGARHLARSDARILGHVGARGTAHSNIIMLDAMFELDEIRVTSRRPESREGFAERLRQEISTPVVVTDSVAQTIDGADIAVEATRLSEPAALVTGDLLAPGSLLVPYGTVSALGPDLLDVVDKVVVDDWREAQSGNFGALRPHMRSGALNAETLHAQLGEVVTGLRPGRENDDERILFWHRGLSILDVAVGQLILERAERSAVGTMVRFR
jgi:ornithine cyclodeaminase